MVLGGVGMVVIPLIVAVSGFGAGLASLYSASRYINTCIIIFLCMVPNF